MRWLTHCGGARATIGCGLALLFVDARLGIAVLLALSGSHLAVQILKRLVARTRPCDTDGRLLALIDAPDPFSFPSGHAAAAMSVAATLALVMPPLGMIAFPLAVTVAASRVVLRVHHVSDVVAGAALGLGAAIGAVHVLF